MKILFIGTVQFSLKILSTIIAENSCVVGVITGKDSNINADYADLSILSQQNEIPCLKTDKINAETTIHWIKQRSPDIIFCMGWSRLIKQELLELAPMGIIGYHPSALPQNRGRHPLIWALILGLKKTGSTFFFMDKDADSGDILDQQLISISNTDDASKLYDKMEQTAKKQIKNILTQLRNKKYTRTPQDHTKANSWRKRGVLDGKIDWRMSARNIHNLVRGLTRPYVGAHCTINDTEYKIWKTKVVANNRYSNIEPGKVVVPPTSKTAIIKCGDEMLELLVTEPQLSLSEGEYL